MKALYYILLALSCVLAITVFILLGYAFSTKKPHKAYEYTGFSLLGVLVAVFSGYLVLNARLKDTFIRNNKDIYSYDTANTTFTINYDDDNNLYQFNVENKKGEMETISLNADRCILKRTETDCPRYYEIKKAWEYNSKYIILIPQNSVIL